MNEDAKSMMSEDAILERLLRIKDRETIDDLLSYNAELTDIYAYFFGHKFLCECSYELQCAVFDISPDGYGKLVDSYFINKVSHLRWDTQLKYIFYPKEFDVLGFMGLTD